MGAPRSVDPPALTPASGTLPLVTPLPGSTVIARPTPAGPARQDWRALVAVFWITSMVEGLGVSQIFALVPTYLRGMGVPEADRLAFVGLFSALIFVVGMPLVPLWGVWADKYSRKAVIVRSALVEAVVFAGVALAREPWQLALSMLLIGFQLGNTGRHAGGHPRRRALAADRHDRSRSSACRGRSGFAVGPVLAGVLIDGLGWSLPAVFWFSAALSIGTALLVWFGSKEVRPEVVPRGRILRARLHGRAQGARGPRRPAHLPHLRRVVPGQPDDPAVHPRPRREPDRPGSRSRVGDRAGDGHRGARRGARLPAGRGHR